MGTIENDGCKVACQLCRVMVASIAEHEGGARHQAARRLAAAALDRLRAHLAPQTNIRDDKTANPITSDCNTNMDQVFCGACASNVPVSEKNHWRCKAHLTEALDEQVLDELVREYVEEEDLPLMEAPSKDPSDEDTGKVVGSCEVAEKYECYLCNVPIPTVFRTEHELSVRHRANLACANAASRRISAYLALTASSILPPETSTADKITPLLKAYVKLGTKEEPEIFEKEKEKVAETEANATAESRSTAKKYFTQVQKHLNEIGDFCELIIDDTEYVTVKAGKNTLRVHVADFNGVYNVGDEMKCRMCDYNNFHKSYSSVKQQDEFHVMTLAHIAHVMSPIYNVHGIRKIDNTHYFCIICNVSLPSGSAVKNHIMTDIQHAALLPKALERGNAFKESKDDLKMIVYNQGTSDTQAVKPPNFYVNKPRLFGPATYSQADEQYNLFAQASNKTNATFGSSTPRTINWPQLNLPGQTCSEHPTENAPLPKCFGTTATAFGTSQSGNLPDQKTPTLFAQASNKTNATFGSSTPRTINWPQLNLPGQTCSEHPTENAPLPKCFGTTASAFGTSQTGNLPDQNTPTLFAQSSNKTNATFGSSTPRTINWPQLNGPGQTCSEHPTENAPLPKCFGTTATAFGTSQSGNLPDQKTPTLFAQTSINSKTLDVSQPTQFGFKPKSQTFSEQPLPNFGTTTTTLLSDKKPTQPK